MAKDAYDWYWASACIPMTSYDVSARMPTIKEIQHANRRFKDSERTVPLRNGMWAVLLRLYLAWYPGCDKYEPGYYCDKCLDANDMHEESGKGFYTLWLELKRRELNETNEGSRFQHRRYPMPSFNEANKEKEAK